MSRELTSAVSEEVAKSRKLCPFTMNAESRSLCEGARCMAWRWVGPQSEPIDVAASVGYCGLVGLVGQWFAPLALQPTFDGLNELAQKLAQKTP